MNTLTILLGLGGLAVGAAVGYIVRHQKAQQAASGIEAAAKRALDGHRARRGKAGCRADAARDRP
jgi:hypothetical protein